MNKWLFNSLIALTVGSTTALLTGCEVSSADSIERSIGVDFTGFYTNGDGSIPSRNSGTSITSLDLRQTGDQLDAIDNEGNIWRGTIAEFNGTTAPFELKGTTTAGKQGHFSGTLTPNGSSGTMTGTYIEDSFYATFYATATIPGVNTNTGGGSAPTISAPQGTTIAVGNSKPFSASGGSGNYSWDVGGSSVGSVTPTTGPSVTVARSGTGSFTLTVRDTGNNLTDSVTIN